MSSNVATPHTTDEADAAAALSAIVRAVRRVDAAIAAADAQRVRLLADAWEYAQSMAAEQRSTVAAQDMALRSVAWEIAAATNASDRSLQRQITEAATLVHDYPETLAARETGVISRAHVRQIMDAGASLPADKRATFDVVAAAVSGTGSPRRVRARILAAAEAAHPRTITERHRAARETRAVRVIPGVNGMSELIATLPTPLARAVEDRLHRMAHVIMDARRDAAAKDTRTADQIRADVLTDLLLTAAPTADPTAAGDGPGALGTIRARIQITIPALSVLRPDQENRDPAELVGHGPIDTDLARCIANATPTPWDRVITHPVTGAVLHTDTYQRTAAIDRFIRARDRHCRAPGCALPAVNCEVDHTHDYALGGPTSTGNLAMLCQRHHSMKQFTSWRVEQLSGGTLRWISPTGAEYIDQAYTYPPAVAFLPDDDSEDRDPESRDGDGSDSDGSDTGDRDVLGRGDRTRDGTDRHDRTPDGADHDDGTGADEPEGPQRPQSHTSGDPGLPPPF